MLERTQRRGKPIDRNPDVPCDECGESYGYDTWEDWYTNITPETRFVCQSCRMILREQAEIEKRKQRNQQITAYQP